MGGAVGVVKGDAVNAEHLHSFCVAAREGSVSAAARALGLSQPAVSRHLRLLERARGAPLYVRRSQGIELTPAGRALLPYACTVSRALEQANAALSGRVTPAATRVRIGLSHHLVTRFTGALLRATKAYTAAGYLLRLHLFEGYTAELEARVAEGSLDAAYVLGDVGAGDGFGARRVGEERVVLLVRDDDPLARAAQLPISALAEETLVVPSSASFIYRAITAALEASATRPGRVLEVSGPAAVRGAVHDSLGIGVTTRSFVEPEVRLGHLRAIALDGPSLTLPVTKLERSDHLLLPDQQHALAFLGSSVEEEPGAPPPGS